MTLVSSRWPLLAAELKTALLDEGENALAAQIDDLRALKECGCGDGFCQGFYTQPPPRGAYGPGHRNVGLNPAGPGMLILDVVDNLIMYVEVIDRPPLA
ncbi:hypothetical protein [Winogradskya humida]|uniref:hypothetical protein n=1 Tax=Winogradskya humida TaxID=113566 RepID=UPI001941A34E|nr:hypothetical protein [Actinoplanes humidus]